MKITLGSVKNKVSNAYLFGSRPIQDWQRIMLVLIIVIGFVLVWGYFFKLSVQSGFVIDSGATYRPAPIKDKEAEIKDVVNKYSAKEQSFNSN